MTEIKQEYLEKGYELAYWATGGVKDFTMDSQIVIESWANAFAKAFQSLAEEKDKEIAELKEEIDRRENEISCCCGECD